MEGTLLAEWLAEISLQRCGQLFPDGWVHYAHRNARGALCCDESSKSEITFAGRAGLTTGILRQHSLANAKLAESFTLHIFTDIDQITQINTIIIK